MFKHKAIQQVLVLRTTRLFRLIRTFRMCWAQYVQLSAFGCFWLKTIQPHTAQSSFARPWKYKSTLCKCRLCIGFMDYIYIILYIYIYANMIDVRCIYVAIYIMSPSLSLSLFDLHTHTHAHTRTHTHTDILVCSLKHPAQFSQLIHWLSLSPEMP